MAGSEFNILVYVLTRVRDCWFNSLCFHSASSTDLPCKPWAAYRYSAGGLWQFPDGQIALASSSLLSPYSSLL